METIRIIGKGLLLFLAGIASFFQVHIATKTITAPPLVQNNTSIPSQAPPQAEVLKTNSSATDLPHAPLVQKVVHAETTIKAQPAEEAPVHIKILGDQKQISPLEPQEIFTITNSERIKNGALPLTWNTKLEEAALAKAKDMIANKYFAHESPAGINVDGLAKIHGYSYSLVGENLALGDFRSSSDVMDGWMNSPGHRRNILKKGYTEIGIVAIRGAYEGREVWYSVQEFGRPPPSCTMPSKESELLIKTSESQMDKLNGDLILKKKTIDSNQQIDLALAIEDFNRLASLYNDLLAKLKSTIESYNLSISIYNSCISKAESDLKALE